MSDYRIVKLEPWTPIHVPPAVPRALRAVGDEDEIFPKIGATNTGPGVGRGAPDDLEWPD